MRGMDNLDYYCITDLNIDYLGKDVGLEALQEAVGGYIVSVPVRSNWKIAYVNEEGRLRNLEPNIMATSLLGMPVCGPLVIGVEGEPIWKLSVD